jgi:hypothetical protein
VNPFVLFMSIRSALRLMFSKEPWVLEQRKEAKEWVKNDLKKPFLEGLKGVEPAPKPKDYLAVKILVTWITVIVLAYAAANWLGW